jgi:hypothetical protein
MEGVHDPNAPEKWHSGVSVPPDVQSWLAATGESVLFAYVLLDMYARMLSLRTIGRSHSQTVPQTVTMPPSVFSFWEDIGWAALE